MLRRMKEKGELVKLNGSSGFSLIEMIIVMAVISGLSSMVIPFFTNYSNKSMGTIVSSDTRNILTLAISHALDTQYYPNSDEIKEQLGTFAAGKELSNDPIDNEDGKKGIYKYTYQRSGATVTSYINAVEGHVEHTITAASAEQSKRINDGLGGIALEIIE